MDLNNKQMKQFIKLFEDICDKKISKLKFMATLPAIVVEDNENGTVDVKIAGDDSVLENIKNPYGFTLSENDKVLLFLPTNSLTNCFVGIKY